jgi:hypothetical protein
MTWNHEMSTPLVVSVVAAADVAVAAVAAAAPVAVTVDAEDVPEASGASSVEATSAHWQPRVL